MLLLYPPSLSGRAHGEVTRTHVNHPSDYPLFPSCFDSVVAFFFNLTCTLLFLGVCDVDPARYRVADT
jgi:hypothetical protein